MGASALNVELLKEIGGICCHADLWKAQTCIHARPSKAWAIKDHLRHLWAMISMDTARDYAIAWAWAAKDTGLKPIIDVFDLVLKHSFPISP